MTTRVILKVRRKKVSDSRHSCAANRAKALERWIAQKLFPAAASGCRRIIHGRRLLRIISGARDMLGEEFFHSGLPIQIASFCFRLAFQPTQQLPSKVRVDAAVAALDESRCDLFLNRPWSLWKDQVQETVWKGEVLLAHPQLRQRAVLPAKATCEAEIIV